jgi:polyisoprenoid-binding protein YceI
MQEHFNEKYMESEKYPVATFTGKIEGYNPEIKTAQQVKAKGTLTIHGVSQSVVIPGTLEQVSNQIRIRTKFIVRLADYKISIPTLLWQNIAEQVEVRVDVNYPTK